MCLYARWYLYQTNRVIEGYFFLESVEGQCYDETRCAVNRHAWRYYIACMLAHAVQAQVRWLAEPMAASD